MVNITFKWRKSGNSSKQFELSLNFNENWVLFSSDLYGFSDTDIISIFISDLPLTSRNGTMWKRVCLSTKRLCQCGVQKVTADLVSGNPRFWVLRKNYKRRHSFNFWLLLSEHHFLNSKVWFWTKTIAFISDGWFVSRI